MQGGNADQKIDAVYVGIGTEYKLDEGWLSETINEKRVLESFTLAAGETRTETVELPVLRVTPVTYDRTDVWIEADMEIPWSLDPDDETPVQVEPNRRMDRVFDAVAELGFTLREAYPEDAGRHYRPGRPFFQEFEYVPRDGPFRADLDELELIFDPTPDALKVIVEVDRRDGAVSEILDVDESVDELVVRDQSTETVTDELAALIERNM